MDHSIEKLQETVARLQKENEELKERLKPKPPSWNCGNCRKYNVGENQVCDGCGPRIEDSRPSISFP